MSPRSIVLAALLALSAPAGATDVRLVGGASWACIAGYGAITADRVENFSYGGHSGTLQLEVWATPRPYSGSAGTGYKVMQHTLGQLTAGFYWYSISSGTVPCFYPPNGTWYITIALTEYVGWGVNDGYEIRDYMNTTPPWVVGTPTPPPPPPPPPASTPTAVEYFHAGFGHYFVTAYGDEIAKLDAGTFAGWSRTGQTFKVYPLNTTGASNVCRFFSTSFGARSSHFYTPFTTECNSVQQNPHWQYEGAVFGMRTPSASGTCSTGTSPLYRLYNNGRSGAPNHRYTANTSTRSQMIGQGWTSEGMGSQGVIGCIPN